MNKLRQHYERLKRERAVSVTAPSGAAFKLSRPRPETYLAGGRLPEHFVITMRRIERGELTAVEGTNLLSAVDEIRFAAYVNDLIIDSVVEPKIVTHQTDDDDELYIGDLAHAQEDYDFLLGCITGLVPMQPVKTKGGETTIKALEDFRGESGGGLSADPGGDVREIPSPTE